MEDDSQNQDQRTPFVIPDSSFAREELLAELDRLNRRLARRDFELIQMKEQREREVLELKKVKAQLEEAKGVLEIKVNAKTKELRDFTANLEQQIKERTRELSEKVDESENSRVALMNMLEDMEDLRGRAQEEKEKTLAIITNFVDGLMFFNASDVLEIINPQVEVYFSLDLDESRQILDKRVSEWGNIKELEPLVLLLGPDLKKIFRKEIALRENMVLEVSAMSVGSAPSKVGTLVIIHDITREKTVERMKTEFVSIAAHQLRTPISAIKWTLRMVLDGDFGPVTNEQKDFLEKTYQSNERMINLINDLLNVTRIEEGRYLYNITAVNLEDVVGKIAETYTEIVKHKHLTLKYQKPDKPLSQVKVDVEKISLVVSNLIENSIKYTPANGTIYVAISEDQGKIKVSVKDSGIGILKSQEERIFTKYFRGLNVVRMETEGTGLGLFISKNIVETHGGKIWFESEENNGTTFFFTLPIASLTPPMPSDDPQTAAVQKL
jgi:signal transduction histidine kinase